MAKPRQTTEHPKIEPPYEKPDLDELRTQCRSLIDGLKLKYASSYQPPALDRAARYAFDTWDKAATENPYTGEAQLDVSSGQSSVERYFLGRLTK